MKHAGLIIVLGMFVCCGVVACTPQSDGGIETEKVFLPPEDLIIANVQETDVSLAFELTAVKSQMKSETELYGEWELTGTLFRIFEGKMQPGESFTCYQIFERGIPAPEIGDRFIGSFKQTEEGKYVVLDNGYLFPYHPDMLGMFEKGAKAKQSTNKHE
ncbi:hypothetical protein K8S19_12690 [bacterium]|nr:hypothetical protein [bacterium]